MVLSLTVRFLFAALVIFCPMSCLAETVLLDFSSPTCGPCRQMRPTVLRLRNDGMPVREVDITREPQLAARHGVKHVPTFIVLVDGRAVTKHVGISTYENLRAMLRPHLPAAAPRASVIPIAQSPDVGRTFAAQPGNVAAPSGFDPNPNARDLSTPQVGRIISLEDPRQRRPAPTAIANPFANAPSRPAAPPRPAAAAVGSPNSLHQRLLASTVKITVDDPQGKSVGTGTIVDARSGEALVLTCGHLFRTSEGKGEILVTTFQAGSSGAAAGASYAGKLIDYDLDRDLALLSIWPTSPVQAVQIAGKTVRSLSPQAPVTSVGCNHGQNPTAIDSRVTSIDRYQGPPNVEVAGAPVEGRSGGGLFNTQGQLVGVCYAADPQGNEGLYAGLPSIYAKLDSLRLTMVYQQGAGSPNVAQQAAPPAALQPKPQAVAAQPVTAIRGQEPEIPSFPVAASPSILQPTTPQTVAPAVAGLPATERAALEEIQRRGLNSEVICIIRPQDPMAKSEVITLHNVSPTFVGALANPGAGTASQPQAAGQGFLR